MLKQFVHSNIPYFDGRVGTRSSNASTARMKLHVIDKTTVLKIRVNAIF